MNNKNNQTNINKFSIHKSLKHCRPVDATSAMKRVTQWFFGMVFATVVNKDKRILLHFIEATKTKDKFEIRTLSVIVAPLIACKAYSRYTVSSCLSILAVTERCFGKIRGCWGNAVMRDKAVFCHSRKTKNGKTLLLGQQLQLTIKQIDT